MNTSYKAISLQEWKNTSIQKESKIGWDEILEGGLAPNATVMSWRVSLEVLKLPR